MEKILAIRDIGFKNHDEGYIIITDKQEIELAIDMSQCCCERPGYFMSEDNIDEYIGANLIGIELTDTALNEVKMKENDVEDIYEGGIMFVDIKTDRGVFQFVAYNEHNGYYGHEARIRSTFLEHEETL